MLSTTLNFVGGSAFDVSYSGQIGDGPAGHGVKANVRLPF